jgi:hypothetical protein
MQMFLLPIVFSSSPGGTSHLVSNMQKQHQLYFQCYCPNMKVIPTSAFTLRSSSISHTNFQQLILIIQVQPNSLNEYLCSILSETHIFIQTLVTFHHAKHSSIRYLLHLPKIIITNYNWSILFISVPHHVCQ